MFTGIVEDLGTIEKIKEEGTNKHFTIKARITPELKIDQSVAHSGVCLTVVDIQDDLYTVTAIKETLDKSNFHALNTGDKVNLERSLTMEQRLDGHMVQGHVDSTAECTEIREADGSWFFRFKYDPQFANLMVEKGSICISGTSLTVFDITEDHFTVAIIPYTYDNTVFHAIKPGDKVNLEFDMMGKYILKYLKSLDLK